MSRYNQEVDYASNVEGNFPKKQESEPEKTDVSERGMRKMEEKLKEKTGMTIEDLLNYGKREKQEEETTPEDDQPESDK